MKKPSPRTMSVSAAAALLSDQLGGAPAHWTQWLKNDRRPGRAHRIPTEPGPGRPRYAPERVRAFIEAERGTQPTIPVDPFPSPGESAITPILLRGAGLFDDAQLREELDDAKLEGTPMDLVAFEVLAGLDRNDQPTIWIRSGLRGGMHLAIAMPFNADQLAGMAGAFE